jgi:hypothetical protein
MRLGNRFGRRRGHARRTLVGSSIPLAGLVAWVAGLPLVATPALGASSVPAWKVTSLAAPTVFAAADDQINAECPAYGKRCDQFNVLVANVSAGASDGSPIVVTDTLPAGLTTKATPLEEDHETGATVWACAPEGAGSQEVSCTYTGGVVPALGQLPPLIVPVQVGAVLPDTRLTNTVTVSGGGAATVQATSRTVVEPTLQPPFGFEGFSDYLADLAGAPVTQAGAHANAFYTNIALNTVHAYSSGYYSGRLGGNSSEPAHDVKDLVFDLPFGLIGDPRALPRCPLNLLPPQTGEATFTTPPGSGCPADTRIGVVTFDILFSSYYHESFSVYNIVPEKGFPAEFAFTYVGQRVVLYASVAHTSTGYVLRVSVPGLPQAVQFVGAEVTFFGNPAVADGGPSPGAAFFRNPSECSGEPLRTTVHADSWEDPAPVGLSPNGSADLSTADFSDPQWQSTSSVLPAVQGCGALSFEPAFSFQPESAKAAVPAGYSVDLHVPQQGLTEPDSLASPDLKKAVVTLPQGVVVNPSVANGLGVCTLAQIGLDSTQSAGCPDSSKIGTVEVDTPLVDHALPGAVYLAAQNENPFHSLVALYVVVDDPQTGVVVKLPGEVKLDPVTGRLTATFDENPQVPFEDLKLAFKGGSRAPLANPQTCGTYTTTTQLTPWSSATPAEPSSNFQIDEGCAAAGFSPAFTAGTNSNQAGAFSPFSVSFSRNDSEQDLSGASVTAPPGLLGILKGVERCGEPQAAQGTCGPSSLIGHTTAAAGVGPDPVSVGGQVFLTGPYKGAPFGLSIVVPAVAGPYNLGNVVVRAAIGVDPHTAQITVNSDPLPRILDGIPLHVKLVNVTVDRSGFVFNPTSCEPLSVAGTLTSTQGTSAGVSSRFQAAGCAGLGFHPSFTVSTQAKTSKQGGASLDVKVGYPTGPQANIHSVAVTLPKQLPSRLTTIQQACTEAVFATNPASCPAGSDIGIATANTPVLAAPVTGPAYLVSHGGAAFPDLVVILQGEGVTVDLLGSIDIKKGVTSSTFASVPDVPVSAFDLVFPEGPHSALTTNLPAKVKGNLCGQKLTMPTTITGQNGAVIKQSTKIAVTGCPKAKTVKKTKKKHKQTKKGSAKKVK